MSKYFIENGTIKNGISYEQYLEEWERYLDQNDPETLSEEEKHRYEFRKLNKHRSSRINKTYNVSEDLKSLLTQINDPQIWMVLTENWCGDSAQILPYIAKIADQSEMIDLKILYRDANLEIMDQYLTEGTSRSIPKLVAFDIEGNEIFQWGPRPKEAQEFVSEELGKGREKQKVMAELHLWYTKDKGRSIENAMSNLIEDYLSVVDGNSNRNF